MRILSAMPTDAEFAALQQRVAALEDLLYGFRSLISAYNRTAPKQADLLSVYTDGSVASNLVTVRDSMVETFKKVTGRAYVFEGAKDGQAVKKLAELKFELRGELLARWEECLKLHPAFPGTHSIAQFSTRVNSFGKRTAAATAPIPVDPYGGP